MEFLVIWCQHLLQNLKLQFWNFGILVFVGTDFSGPKTIVFSQGIHTKRILQWWHLDKFGKYENLEKQKISFSQGIDEKRISTMVQSWKFRKSGNSKKKQFLEIPNS